MKIHELGHVVLFVTNLEKLANFYRDTLGFHEVARDEKTALFGGGRTHHELLLIEIGLPRSETGGVTGDKRKPRPGLYHIGFKIGDTTEELKAAYQELKTQGVNIVGTADHGVTHSLYIKDPDGNELELYADVNDEWKTNPLAVLTPVKYLNLDE
jgi:catechol 2,3-dioxygenase